MNSSLKSVLIVSVLCFTIVIIIVIIIIILSVCLLVICIRLYALFGVKFGFVNIKLDFETNDYSY